MGLGQEMLAVNNAGNTDGSDIMTDTLALKNNPKSQQRDLLFLQLSLHWSLSRKEGGQHVAGVKGLIAYPRMENFDVRI